jgi:hypothetical protein
MACKAKFCLHAKKDSPFLKLIGKNSGLWWQGTELVLGVQLACWLACETFNQPSVLIYW